MAQTPRAALLSVLFGLALAAPGAARAQVDIDQKDPVDNVPGVAPTGTITGHEKFVYGVAFSPDGKQIATAGEDYAALWDARTGKLLHKLNPGEAKAPSAHSVAFAPDGKTVAVGGVVGDVYFYAPDTGKLKGVFDEPSLASLGLAYSSDGAVLATTHDQNSVMLYDVKAAKLIDTLKPPKGTSLSAFALSGDGKTLVTATRDGLAFWDVATRKVKKAVEHETPDPLASFDAVACSPVAPLAAVCGGKPLGQKAVFFDLKALRPTGGLALGSTQFGSSEPTIHALAFSPDGKVLATGPKNGIGDRTPVSLWDVSSGERFGALTGSTQGITSLAFSPDGRRVVAGGFDNTARVWDLPASGAKGTAKARTGAKSNSRTKAKAKRKSR